MSEPVGHGQRLRRGWLSAGRRPSPVRPPLTVVGGVHQHAHDGLPRLRVAMVAPLYFGAPSVADGGIDAVIADLVDALVGRGHEITLVGAWRHATIAQRFIATYQTGFADQRGDRMPELVYAAKVAAVLRAINVDVIHDHTVTGPLVADGRQLATVVTVHGPVDGERAEFYRKLGEDARLVATSDAQRSAAPDLPWTATIRNAIRAEMFPFRTERRDYALFLGRFHPEKAPHLAIDAARAAGVPIVLAGKCSEPDEQAYFRREIEPRIDSRVTIFGGADSKAKRTLLAQAACLLLPVTQDKPFGSVVIEAMVCGTPVVALRRRAVPEPIVHGQTGIIVDDPVDLAHGITQAWQLDPALCRKHVESFTIQVMAASYEAVYRQALSAARLPLRAPR
jgi:glycosyltransferase involved in cell wall biosynthesis